MHIDLRPSLKYSKILPFYSYIQENVQNKYVSSKKSPFKINSKWKQCKTNQNMVVDTLSIPNCFFTSKTIVYYAVFSFD